MSQTTPAIINLLGYSTVFRVKIIWATISSILNKLFDIAPEILIGIAIDVVVNRELSFLGKFGVVDPMQQLFVLGGLTFFIWLFESIFEYLYLISWRNLAQLIQHELRIDAYEHLQQQDISYFEESTTGGLVSILNDDVNQLERFLNVGANNLIQVMTTIIAIGGIFFYISPILALFSFLPIPVVVGGAFYFQKRAQPLYAAVRTRVSNLNSRLANNISGIATIKSFVAEKRELDSVRRDSEAYGKANQKAIALSSGFIPIIRMAILAGFLVTFLLGGSMVMNGALNVGSYGVLVFLTQRLLWPLTGMADTVDLYERAMASTRRVLELIHAPIVIKSAETRGQISKIEGAVGFRNVDFSYPSRSKVLHGLNFEIKAGETIGIVGSTGSGKSTIVKLLLRFYEVTGGAIHIDGHDIREVPLAELRHSIGFVSQDVFLFHGTVRENIAYGSPEASDSEIEKVARLAEAHDFIVKLPDGYGSIVGERGQKLSGGQRQRISIARAILKKPPIIVFDEATSAVDNETEAAIQRSLKKIAIGRTTIIIAHRLSTVTHADQILVVNDGRIVETGKSGALVAQGGLYANLWNVQVGRV